jgi:hypothetical protein
VAPHDARQHDANVGILIAIALGILGVFALAVMIGLFGEERALEVPRLYEDESLRK